MYDDWVKRLRELASIPEHCENVSDCDKCTKEEICLSFTNKRIIEVATRAADAIEELQAQLMFSNDAAKKIAEKVPKWIPVTERLPKTSGVYLAWMQWDLTDPDDNPSAYPVEYDAEEEAFGWWDTPFDPESLGWAGEDFIRYEGVTHWMPLPESPEN